MKCVLLFGAEEAGDEVAYAMEEAAGAFHTVRASSSVRAVAGCAAPAFCGTKEWGCVVR
jgi:hypothetical protein